MCRIRQDAAQFGRDCYLVLRQWCLVAWYLAYCVVLTVRLLACIVLWTVRVLTPIPRPVGAVSRYQRQSTGLAIPAIDVLVVTFGICCAGQLLRVTGQHARAAVP